MEKTTVAVLEERVYDKGMCYVTPCCRTRMDLSTIQSWVKEFWLFSFFNSLTGTITG